MSGRTKRGGKRESILAAARTIFIDNGYEASSVDLIATTANVSKATVYAHFGDKEKLFTAMVEAYSTELAPSIEAIDASEPDTEEALFKIALAVMSLWSDLGALRFNRLIMGEAARFPKLGRAFVEAGTLRVQRIVAELFEHFNQEGRLAVEDPELAAELFVAMTRSPVQIRSLARLGKAPPRNEIIDIARSIAKVTVRSYAVRSR